MYLRLYWKNESNTCTSVKDNHLCPLDHTGKNESNTYTSVKDNYLCTLGHTGKIKVTLAL